MDITATSHIPTEQYGFIQIDHPFKGGSKDEFFKEVINDYNLVQQLFDRSRPKEDQYKYYTVSGVKWRELNGKREYLSNGEWKS